MSDGNDSNRMRQKRGASWIRADFHIHTISETGASRKKYRAEFDGREGDFPKEFVDKLEEHAIRIAVITNHNTFDLPEYKQIAKKGRKKGILVLPGVELGVQGGSSTIHTLIIFDPQNLTAENDFINRFLLAVFPGGAPSEGSATSGNLPDCIQRLEQLGESYFVVFAHVESDNGLLKDLKKTALQPMFESVGKDTWNRRILGFQGVRSTQKWVEDKLPTGMPIPAFVEGSDPDTSIQQIGRKDRGTCFLKVSELTFHSVRFALRDHLLRVRTIDPIVPAGPRIHSIGIDGGKRKIALYNLSDNLNTLIGSRGSGKSLMIEALRWCLNLELGQGDSTYKLNLIHAFLDRGATVIVRGITTEGKPFEISRSYTSRREQPAPKVKVDGEILAIRVHSILPGVLYFGQKDLGERDKEATDNIFEQLLPMLPKTLQTNAARALDEFEKAIDTYLLAKKAQEKDDELRFNERNLAEKLKAFNERGVEDRLKEITGFDQDIRRLQELYRAVQKERKTLQEAYRPDNDIEEWGDVLQSELNVDLNLDLAALQSTYNMARTNISSGIESLELLEQHIADIEKKLLAKLNEKQESFAGILRELNQPDLDIDAYRDMVSRLQHIKETRARTKETKGKIGIFEQEVIKKGRSWHEALRAMTDYNRDHIVKINDRLPEDINIHQDFQGDKDSFREFLEGIFSGSGFNATSYDALINGAIHGLDLFARRESFQATELTPKMSRKFAAKLEEHFKQILTFSPPDLRIIEYGGIRINELSLGKRAMALLLLLLSLDTNSVIILDQPEDDLDNETIHSYIVKPLVENKDRVQFIIATHNPNVPVLGDAEQVIACCEEVKGQYREDFGSLDMPETKDAIIKIMEGGSQAFQKRHDIYTLWARPH